MLRRFITGLTIVAIAFAILFVSILRSVSVRPDFMNVSDGNTYHSKLLDQEFHLDYELAFPGKILPDSPFWPLKAARDKFWIMITVDSGKKAELYLLLADKRLGASVILFENKKYDEAYTSLLKGEEYLLMALEQGMENKRNGLDTDEFFLRLTNASLKHAITIEELAASVPDVVVTEVNKVNDIPKKVYTDARNALREAGIETPNNPFQW